MLVNRSFKNANCRPRSCKRAIDLPDLDTAIFSTCRVSNTVRMALHKRPRWPPYPMRFVSKILPVERTEVRFPRGRPIPKLIDKKSHDACLHVGSVNRVSGQARATGAADVQQHSSAMGNTGSSNKISQQDRSVHRRSTMENDGADRQ
jgi:hypothetical protein